MASHRSSRSATGWSAASSTALLIIGILAIMAGLLAIALSGPATMASAEISVTHGGRSGFAWPLEQARDLIDEIGAAGAYGLNPADYGVDALKSELVQAAELFGSDGSSQLDSLADAAATALAADYQRRSHAVPSSDLRTALRDNRLRAWFAEVRPSPIAKGGVL